MGSNASLRSCRGLGLIQPRPTPLTSSWPACLPSTIRRNSARFSINCRARNLPKSCSRCCGHFAPSTRRSPIALDCSLNHSNIGPVAGGYNDKSLGAYQPYGCFVPGQWQTWARVWGGWNNNDGDANAPGYNESQWAIWGGADYAISETFFLGAAGGFFRSDNMDFDKFGGVSGGSIEYDGGQVAGYGGWDNRVWYDRAS